MGRYKISKFRFPRAVREKLFTADAFVRQSALFIHELREKRNKLFEQVQSMMSTSRQRHGELNRLLRDEASDALQKITRIRMDYEHSINEAQETWDGDMKSAHERLRQEMIRIDDTFRADHHEAGRVLRQSIDKIVDEFRQCATNQRWLALKELREPLEVYREMKMAGFQINATVRKLSERKAQLIESHARRQVAEASLRFHLPNLDTLYDAQYHVNWEEQLPEPTKRKEPPIDRFARDDL